MSFINFNHHPRRRAKSRRTKRKDAQDRKRYKEWSRRKPKYVKVRHGLIPPPSHHYQPKPINYPVVDHRIPTGIPTAAGYVRNQGYEKREAYEWVGKGCLIGIREIYITVI